MKILNILPFLPWPLVTGGHNGVYHSIEALKDEMDYYVLFPFEDNKADLDYMTKLWPNVKWIPYQRKSRFARKWHLKVKSLYFKIQRFLYPGFNENLEWNFELDSERYEDTFLQCITDCINKYNIDTVQVEFPVMLSLVLWLPDSVKKIFIHHELRFVKNDLILKSNNICNPYYEFYKRKSQNEEISLLNRYDKIITFSSIDSDKLIKAGVIVPCYSSFLIVDQKPMEEFVPATNKITFLGSGGHMPNLIGLRWFLDAEWKNIMALRPDIRLIIVGCWSSEIQEEILRKYQNIEFRGFVENLRNELAGSVMVVPLTIGSGIRIKILECTSLCVPFVTTSIGVEGLPFKDGKDCAIEDTTVGLSKKIIELLNDPIKQQQYAESAYKVVSKCYSLDAFKQSRVNIMNE